MVRRQDAKDLAPSIKSAIVIGAGYIGAELAEQFALTDKEVTLIDGLPRVLAKNFDATITDRVEKLYTDHGVHLALNEMVTEFAQADQGIKVTTNKGDYTADIAILCTGFRPNTDLLKDHLDTLPNGAVITNAYMQTSDPTFSLLVIPLPSTIIRLAKMTTSRLRPTQSVRAFLLVKIS